MALRIDLQALCNSSLSVRHGWQGGNAPISPGALPVDFFSKKNVFYLSNAGDMDCDYAPGYDADDDDDEGGMNRLWCGVECKDPAPEEWLSTASSCEPFDNPAQANFFRLCLEHHISDRTGVALIDFIETSKPEQLQALLKPRQCRRRAAEEQLKEQYPVRKWFLFFF